MIRTGIIKLYLQLPAEGRKRYFKELLPLLHRTKTEVLRERDEDSYYLVYIGTKSGARGRGYATKLIRDMIVKVRNIPLTTTGNLLRSLLTYDYSVLLG